MPTHDQVISNSTFPAVRADINSALAALFSLSSNTSAPSTTLAGMLWYDTTNAIIKQRNAADSGWLHLWAIGKQGLIDQNGSTVYAADSVGSDSYAITLVPAITAYATGQVFRFKAGTANTGAATLNVNALGAITINKNYNSNLVTGDILANQLVEVIYDGTNFQLLSPVAATPVAATQSDQETGTSNTAFVTPGVQHFHASAAKAWVNFNGTGTIAIRVSYNVTSLNDLGTGDYRVNLTNSFSTANYCVVTGGTGIDPASDLTGGGTYQGPAPHTLLAGSFKLFCGSNTASAGDWPLVCAAAFGDL